MHSWNASTAASFAAEGDRTPHGSAVVPYPPMSSKRTARVSRSAPVRTVSGR